MGMGQHRCRKSIGVPVILLAFFAKNDLRMMNKVKKK
jgi:hypothetical protein